jgi:hypothetical protein
MALGPSLVWGNRGKWRCKGVLVLTGFNWHKETFSSRKRAGTVSCWCLNNGNGNVGATLRARKEQQDKRKLCSPPAQSSWASGGEPRIHCGVRLSPRYGSRPHKAAERGAENRVFTVGSDSLPVMDPAHTKQLSVRRRTAYSLWGPTLSPLWIPPTQSSWASGGEPRIHCGVRLSLRYAARPHKAAELAAESSVFTVGSDSLPVMDPARTKQLSERRRAAYSLWGPTLSPLWIPPTQSNWACGGEQRIHCGVRLSTLWALFTVAIAHPYSRQRGRYKITNL